MTIWRIPGDPQGAAVGSVAVIDARRSRIAVAAAIGRGRTMCAASDDARRLCHLHNANLLDRSPIIPPQAEIFALNSAGMVPASEEEFGRCLWVVRGEAWATEAGTIVAAGLGHAQWGDGRGVFAVSEIVAPAGSVEGTEVDLVAELRASLEDLCTARNVAFASARVGYRVAAARVDDRPTAALVLAIFHAEAGWREG
jgi:pyruvoyl-dependent arginine decarboxylase (PvlArgDC)